MEDLRVLSLDIKSASNLIKIYISLNFKDLNCLFVLIKPFPSNS